MELLLPYNLFVDFVIQSIIDGTFQSFHLVLHLCCIYLSSNVRSCVHVMQSALIGCPQFQESLFPFFNNISRFQICCMQFCIFREQPIFHSPFLPLNVSKYCCVVWHTLFLLSFCKQTRCDALFLCAPQINCIYHIPHFTNPLIFFHTLVSVICSCNANIDSVFLGSVLHFNQLEFSSLYYFGVWLL